MFAMCFRFEVGKQIAMQASNLEIKFSISLKQHISSSEYHGFDIEITRINGAMHFENKIVDKYLKVIDNRVQSFYCVIKTIVRTLYIALGARVV